MRWALVWLTRGWRSMPHKQAVREGWSSSSQYKTIDVGVVDLGEQLTHDMRWFKPGESNFGALMSSRQFPVANAQLVQHGCMQVADMNHIYYCVVSEFIGFAMRSPKCSLWSNRSMCVAQRVSGGPLRYASSDSVVGGSPVRSVDTRRSRVEWSAGCEG